MCAEGNNLVNREKLVMGERERIISGVTSLRKGEDMGSRGPWISSVAGGESENVVPEPCTFRDSKTYMCLGGGVGKKFQERENMKELLWKSGNGTLS